jgi:hypothetical protein
MIDRYIGAMVQDWDWEKPVPEGFKAVVLYADHEKALAQAVQDERDKWIGLLNSGTLMKDIRKDLILAEEAGTRRIHLSVRREDLARAIRQAGEGT